MPCPDGALQQEGVLQNRNTEFFSLEYCPAMAIIRGAMAGNKTERFGHVKNPAVTPAWLHVSNLHFPGGAFNESAQ
jgi:hypothetical protein